MAEPESPDLDAVKAKYEGMEIDVEIHGITVTGTVDIVRLGDGGGFLMESSFYLNDDELQL